MNDGNEFQIHYFGAIVMLAHINWLMKVYLIVEWMNKYHFPQVLDLPFWLCVEHLFLNVCDTLNNDSPNYVYVPVPGTSDH